MLESLLAFMCASFAPCLATLGDAALCLVLESCDKRCRWSAYYDEAWVIDKVPTEYVEPCLVCVLVQCIEAAHIIERRSKTLAEIGIDSVGLVEAIFALEESFDVQVPFNANDPSESDFDISSVASIVRAVEALVAAKH